MGNTKTAGETESGKYTEKQAEADGWLIVHEREPEAARAGIAGGGAIEVLVQPGSYRAEKTVDDHMITASGETKEKLLEAIRSQQVSLDNRPRSPRVLPILNDQAGNAEGEENVGLAGVLPETAVPKPDAVRALEEADDDEAAA